MSNLFEVEVFFQKNEIIELLNSSDGIDLLRVHAFLELDAQGNGQMDTEADGVSFDKEVKSRNPVQGCPGKCPWLK